MIIIPFNPIVKQYFTFFVTRTAGRKALYILGQSGQRPDQTGHPPPTTPQDRAVTIYSLLTHCSAHPIPTFQITMR